MNTNAVTNTRGVALITMRPTSLRARAPAPTAGGLGGHVKAGLNVTLRLNVQLPLSTVKALESPTTSNREGGGAEWGRSKLG